MRTYDPKQVIVNWANETLVSFADGTFLNATRTSDLWELFSGSDGEITRIKSNDKSGIITLTLTQSSPSNTVLQAAVNADEIANTGIFPFLAKDFTSETAQLAAANTFVKRIPDWARATGGGSDIEWVFACDVLRIAHGTGLLTTAVALGVP